MGNRNFLVLLGVVLALVLVWNVLYFTGTVGDFYGTTDPFVAAQPPTNSQFDIPGLNRDSTAPRPSGRGQQAQPAPVAPRAEVTAAELTIDSNWGRNPFFTPQEIWAVENYAAIQVAAPNPIPAGGLLLSAVLSDSTGRRKAVINNNVVGIGDVIAGMEVVDVLEDAVVFRVGTDRHVLRMNDAAVGLTVRGNGAGR